MMKITKLKILFYVTLVFSILLMFACSSSKNSGSNKNEGTETDSVYVFDEIPSDTVEQVSLPESTKVNTKEYFVQIGAFSTKDKAEEFAKLSRMKIKSALKIAYNKRVKLYTVRIATPYNSRSEAEQVRNELWKIKDFNDAWIVEQNK